MKEELHSRLVPVLVDVVDATSVEGRGPTDDAMDLRSDGKETSRNDERIADELSWIRKRNPLNTWTIGLLTRSKSFRTQISKHANPFGQILQYIPSREEAQ